MYNLVHNLRRPLAWMSILLCFSLIHVSAYAQDSPSGPELKITIIDGDEAINNIRQRTAREPIVQVEDENNRPVAGAAVVFLLPNDGAGGTFTGGAKSLSVMTDANGRAVARGLRPNNVAGRYQIRVTATSQGRTGRAVLQQTNVKAAGAAASAGLTAKFIAFLAVNVAVVVGLDVYIDKRNGGKPNPISITPGSSTIGPP
jgi:hypothetical protein